MNKQTLQLAQQAGLKKSPATDREYLGDFDWRLFAQLIVRECIIICDEVQRQYGQYTFTATKVKENIKDHFGVE